MYTQKIVVYIHVAMKFHVQNATNQIISRNVDHMFKAKTIQILLCLIFHA